MNFNNVGVMRRVALVCLYSSIVSLFAGAFNVYLFIIPSILFSSFLIISWLFWRCGSCGIGLPLRHGGVDSGSYCPYCGGFIRSDIIKNDFKSRLKIAVIILIVINVISLIIIGYNVRDEKLKVSFEESLTNQVTQLMYEDSEMKRIIKVEENGEITIKGNVTLHQVGGRNTLLIRVGNDLTMIHVQIVENKVISIEMMKK